MRNLQPRAPELGSRNMSNMSDEQKLRQDNEDWIKGYTWEVGGLKPADTLESLLGALNLDYMSMQEQQEGLRHFLTLRASLPMPATLRMEVDKFLQRKEGDEI